MHMGMPELVLYTLSTGVPGGHFENGCHRKDQMSLTMVAPDFSILGGPTLL